MAENVKPYCPECEETNAEALDRRHFMKGVAGTATLLAAGAAAPSVLGQAAQPRPAQAVVRQAKPAEALIQELYQGMTADQRRTVCLPWNHRDRTTIAPNHALNNQFLGEIYTRPQQELIERIVRSICSGDDGYRQISRAGTWDASRSLDRCGSHIFGTPGPNQQ